jgi:hypothetical protein
MKLSEFQPFFASVIDELKASSDDTAAFRLKNYKKWQKLLAEAASEDDIEIESVEDIDGLNIPDKMKIKMQEIFKEGSINGQRLQVAEAPKPEFILPTVKYDLRNFYGFGDATSKKFEDEGITGDHLIDDWNAYVALDRNNEIIMLSKRPRPAKISKQDWDSLSDEQRHDKAFAALMHDLESRTRYLHKLTYHQLIGVKHYFNIMKKIPRAEMLKIQKVLKHALNLMNPDLILTICGSFRRERPESGDIDCFITHKDIHTNDNAGMLSDIIKGLTNINFLVDHLTENGKTKYMGLCKVADTPRRIDIRIISWDSYPFATLYFTGSKNNNTDMRIIAKKKGYKLNEYGMESILDHSMVKCTSEHEIYEFLGMKYLTPKERDY